MSLLHTRRENGSRGEGGKGLTGFVSTNEKDILSTKSLPTGTVRTRLRKRSYMMTSI